MKSASLGQLPHLTSLINGHGRLLFSENISRLDALIKRVGALIRGWMLLLECGRSY